TDRSYLIKDGLVRTHGTPQQIIHDPIAINEYLGASFNDDRITGPPPGAPPAEAPAPAEVHVHQLLEQEKIHRLIERLRTDDSAAALAELVQRGRAAVPGLLEALERRDVEMRRLAFTALHQIVGGAAVFDPYAPEAQRRQQIAGLREKLERKAG